MSPIKVLSFQVPVIAALVIQMGCATGQNRRPASDGNYMPEGARFYDSAFDDHNRAPAGLTPKWTPEGTGANVDPVYQRTQADYYFSLGEAQSLEGNHEAAIEAFKSVLVYDPEAAPVELRIATEYVKLGVVSRGLEHAQVALKKDPKSVEAHLLIAGIYSGLKDYAKATEEYNITMKLDPQNTDAPLYLGAIYAEQKDYDKSVKSFMLLVNNEDYGSAHLAYYYIGRVRLEQNVAASDKLAEQAFRKSLELKPSYPDSAIALASLYQKKDDDNGAISLLATFQKEYGPNGRVAEILSRIYIERNDFPNALAQFEILESTGDDPVGIKARIAMILIEEKKYDQAAAKLKEVLEQAPDSDKILFYLAAVYEQTEKQSLAVEYFAKVPKASSYFAEAVAHQVYILKSQKNPEGAVKVAELAYAARPDLPQVIVVYASTLDEKKDYAGAVAVLQKGIAKFPEQVQLKFFMGTVEDHLGNKDAVISQMKAVVELDPNHVQGLNYLAFTYADEGRNLEEAEHLARRALEIDPHDGFILDTLGWILFKRGDFNGSVKVLEAAFKTQSAESVIAEHLGDAYLKVQLVDNAKKMYQRAVELETEDDKRKDLRAKLSGIENPQASLPDVKAVTRKPASDK